MPTGGAGSWARLSILTAAVQLVLATPEVARLTVPLACFPYTASSVGGGESFLVETISRRTPANWRRGALPPWTMTIAPRYKAVKIMDVVIMRAKAPVQWGKADSDGIPRMINAQAHPASTDASR